MCDQAYGGADETEPEPDDVNKPFDHDGCYQPHVSGGEYYDCDGRPL